jgi:hypothetical protein
MFGPQHAQAGQSCLKWAVGLESTQSASSKHPECLQLPTTQKHVPEWPKSVMFGPQHAQAWSVIPELGSENTQNTSSCQNGQINHVWPTSCLSRSVMPELGSESTLSASSCLPHTNMCQNGQNQSIVPQAAYHSPTCARISKINYVLPTACPGMVSHA